MREALYWVAAVALLGWVGPTCSDAVAAEEGSTLEVEIVISWQGDYPVAKLDRLPERQREQGVGFIGDAVTFKNVFEAFKPGEDISEVDFEAHLVLFARNTHFHNRVSIGQIKVTKGVADVLAMETMSAAPIEDQVGMALVVVARKGISAVRVGDQDVSIESKK